MKSAFKWKEHCHKEDKVRAWWHVALVLKYTRNQALIAESWWTFKVFSFDSWSKTYAKLHTNSTRLLHPFHFLYF